MDQKPTHVVLVAIPLNTLNTDSARSEVQAFVNLMAPGTRIVSIHEEAHEEVAAAVAAAPMVAAVEPSAARMTPDPTRIEHPVSAPPFTKEEIDTEAKRMEEYELSQGLRKRTAQNIDIQIG